MTDTSNKKLFIHKKSAMEICFVLLLLTADLCFEWSTDGVLVELLSVEDYPEAAA